MAISGRVFFEQYGGGYLPDMILLTLGDQHWGTQLKLPCMVTWTFSSNHSISHYYCKRFNTMVLYLDKCVDSRKVHTGSNFSTHTSGDNVSCRPSGDDNTSSGQVLRQQSSQRVPGSVLPYGRLDVDP